MSNVTGPPTYVGHVIGASFGLVFVGVNSSPLMPALRLAICLLAAASFGLVVAGWVKTLRTGRQQPSPATSDRFDRTYWLIVAIEAVALFAGLAVISRIEPAANLGWIALVVGLHFIALARVWPAGRADMLGIAIAMIALGIVGLVVAFFSGRVEPVMIIAGVGSGVGLTGSTTRAALQTLLGRAHAA